jgi:hypothetical protein
MGVTKIPFVASPRMNLAPGSAQTSPGVAHVCHTPRVNHLKLHFVVYKHKCEELDNKIGIFVVVVVAFFPGGYKKLQTVALLWNTSI